MQNIEYQCVGYGFVPAVAEGLKTDLVHQTRIKLAQKGFLLPVIRLKDSGELSDNTFQIIAYDKIMYEKTVSQENMNSDIFVYMINKLADIVSDYQNYAYILNREMVKILVDNAAKKYPILVQEVVPAKVSYGYALD